MAPPHSAGYPIPEQKSLFGTHNERGLPIGNLTSQFWANVYLAELDQYVKRQLRCRYYIRYVDDLVLLANEPTTLWRWRGEIAAFVAARLKLRLRDTDAEPQPAGRGIEFVGWGTFWNHRRPRGQTLANRAARLKRFDIRAGYTVVEVREVRHFGPRCAQRQVVSVWVPARSARQAAAGSRDGR